MSRFFWLAIYLLGLSVYSENSFSWGGRGHHTICDAAVFLVKEPGLKEYLQNKPFMMGHLCNVPDFYWKSLGGEANSLGNSTHFIDVEITGMKIKEVPTDYNKIISDFTGKENQIEKGMTIKSVPFEFGSNWWRADQFYRLAIKNGEIAKSSAAPANKKEEQDDTLAYNKAAFEMVVAMGLMGHFVGDNAQPFHVSVDYDGYLSGHGGIHAYYEDSIVANQPYNLQAMVVEKAKILEKAVTKDKANPNFLDGKLTVIERMKNLAILSDADIKPILKLDPIIKPSNVKEEKGMKIKTAAERKPANQIAPKFKSLIITEMARASLLLAQLWDEAYRKSGAPTMGAFKSYKYPFTPEFIAPDYYTVNSVNPSNPVNPATTSK